MPGRLVHTEEVTVESGGSGTGNMPGRLVHTEEVMVESGESCTDNVT